MKRRRALSAAKKGTSVSSWSAITDLEKGHVVQGGVGVEELDDKELEDEGVLVLGVRAVVLPVRQLEGDRPEGLVRHGDVHAQQRRGDLRGGGSETKKKNDNKSTSKRKR